MASTMLAWNGRRVLFAGRARVPLADRGHLLGEGVFETMVVHEGAVVRESSHRARFCDGCHALGIEGASDGFGRAVEALRDAAGPGVWRLRVQATRGGWSGLLDGAPTQVTGLLSPLVDGPRTAQVTVAAMRRDARDPLVRVKHTSRAPEMHARLAARRAGFDEALLLNQHGRVAEATTSNVIAVVGGRIHAPGPAEGALPGVTREAVLARLGGHRVVERLGLGQLRRASEAWLTNTTQGVVPIVGIDGRAIPSVPTLGPALQQAVAPWRVPEDGA